jgi:hypothetical protein
MKETPLFAAMQFSDSPQYSQNPKIGRRTPCVLCVKRQGAWGFACDNHSSRIVLPQEVYLG